MNNDSDKVRLFVMDNTLTFIPQVFENRSFKNAEFKSFDHMKNMIEAIRHLSTENTGIEVYVLSSCSDAKSMHEKNRWYDKYLPSICETHRIFLNHAGYDRGVPGGVGINDFLLDCCTENLDRWKYAGGQGIKLKNELNENDYWKGLEIFTDRKTSVFKYELISKISSAVIDTQFIGFLNEVDSALSRIGGIAVRKYTAKTKGEGSGEKCPKKIIEIDLTDGRER